MSHPKKKQVYIRSFVFSSRSSCRQRCVSCDPQREGMKMCINKTIFPSYIFLYYYNNNLKGLLLLLVFLPTFELDRLMVKLGLECQITLTIHIGVRCKKKMAGSRHLQFLHNKELK